jgi:hypothetical protein
VFRCGLSVRSFAVKLMVQLAARFKEFVDVREGKMAVNFGLPT